MDPWRSVAKISRGALALVLALWVGSAARAAVAPPARFAAISIRQVKRIIISGALIQTDPASFRATARSLDQLIQYAYDIEPYQLLGGDRWTKRTLFDVQATTSAPATEPQMRLMLRAALKTRFGLQLVQKREATPVYALVAGPGGIKSRPLAFGEKRGRASPSPPGVRIYHFTNTHDLVVEMDGLGAGRVLGRTLVDETGLKGRYDIVLAMPSRPAAMYGRVGTFVDFRSELPPALRKLGLDLKPKTVTMDYYQIQNAHLPNGN